MDVYHVRQRPRHLLHPHHRPSISRSFLHFPPLSLSLSLSLVRVLFRAVRVLDFREFPRWTVEEAGKRFARSGIIDGTPRSAPRGRQRSVISPGGGISREELSIKATNGHSAYAAERGHVNWRGYTRFYIFQQIRWCAPATTRRDEMRRARRAIRRQRGTREKERGRRPLEKCGRSVLSSVL